MEIDTTYLIIGFLVGSLTFFLGGKLILKLTDSKSEEFQQKVIGTAFIVIFVVLVAGIYISIKNKI